MRASWDEMQAAMTPSAEPTAHTELMIGAPVRLVWSATVVLSQANLTGGTTEWDIENRIGFENSLSSTLAALARLLE